MHLPFLPPPTACRHRPFPTVTRCLYEFDNTLELKGADGLVLMTPGFSVREVASIFR